MSGRRGGDPVENALDAAFGWIVGRSFSGWLGFAANQNAKKHRKQVEEQRVLRLPSSLESYQGEPPAEASSSYDFIDHALAFVLRNGKLVVLGATVLCFFIFQSRGLMTALIASGVCLVVGTVVRLLLPVTLWTGSRLNSMRARAESAPTTGSTRLVRRVYTIEVPTKGEWRPIHAGDFMTTLLHRFVGLAFQIEATHEDIRWRILDLRCDAEPADMATAIRSFYPGAEVTWAEDSPPAEDRFFFRYVMHFQHEMEFFFPMKRVDDLKPSDPFVAMTQEMNTLLPGERVVYSLYVSEWARFAHEQMPNFMFDNPPPGNPLAFLSNEGMFDAIARAGLDRQSIPHYVPEEMNLIATKALKPLYLAFLMVQVDAGTRERVLALSQFNGYLRQLEDPVYNGVVATEYSSTAGVENIVMAQQDDVSSIEGIIGRWLNGSRDWQRHFLILDAREVAALWHLPTKEYTASKIAWHTPQVFVPMPKNAKVDEGLCLGYNGDPALGPPVYMPLANRTTHMAVIGRTGTGKSTLLHNLIHQDIAAGRGVAVIDPHGTLVRELLERSIPPEREADVVLLDFAQEAYPPPLNPLLIPEGAAQRDAAGRMMTLIERIYQGFEGQMADTLNMTLLTLMHEETPTLRDVTRLFNDPKYRYRLTEQLDNPAAEDFWDTFNHLSKGEQDQRRSPVEHRLRAFYSNPALYPILCHPKTLNLPELIREQRIVLVSLETKRRGIPEREAHLLGAILVANFQMAVMGHAAMEHGFALYIDEAEDFVRTSLDEMMAESRFANLSLVLANQYLKQLAGDTLEAVLANIGAMAAFQCHEPDAKVLLPYLRPHFELENLLNVDAYQAALWMRSGKQQAVMSLSTAPKPERPKDVDERVARIRAQSIKRYTPLSKDEVLAWLKERYPKPAPPPDDDTQWYDKDTP